MGHPRTHAVVMHEQGLSFSNHSAFSFPTKMPAYTAPSIRYVYNVHSDGKGIEKRDSDEWITVENHHEPILNEDVFCRMKFLLTRNKRGGVPSQKHTSGRTSTSLLACSAAARRLQHDSQPRPAASERLRPSHACGSRRRKGTSCTNKYISDTTLRPFVLNYVANIIRASKNSSGGHDARGSGA
ncbi:MAG: hypothetical protein ACLVJ6_07420 [Merdibacter sp.]